jgi:hypothetical protein
MVGGVVDGAFQPRAMVAAGKPRTAFQA